MELTKEHFDKQTTLNKEHFDQQLGKLVSKKYFDRQFNEVNNRLDNMATKAELKQEVATIRSEMVTKDDLQTALKAQNEDLQEYTDDVAASIIQAVDASFTRINKRLNKDLIY